MIALASFAALGWWLALASTVKIRPWYVRDVIATVYYVAKFYRRPIRHRHRPEEGVYLCVRIPDCCCPRWSWIVRALRCPRRSRRVWWREIFCCKVELGFIMRGPRGNFCESDAFYYLPTRPFWYRWWHPVEQW